MQDRAACGDARECIRAARVIMRQVKELLRQPSAESAERSAAILSDAEVQLGCAAAILKAKGSGRDFELRSEVEELRDEVAVLARLFAESDKMLAGWLGAIRTKRGGYTERGQAAPLALVNKLSLEG